MIFERMQIGQVEIDDLFFYRPSGVTGRRWLRRDLRTGGSAALIHGRLLRDGLTLGLFVPRFGRLCLIESSLALLGRTASAGLGSLVLFRGRLLPAFLFLLLGRLVTGGGKSPPPCRNVPGRDRPCREWAAAPVPFHPWGLRERRAPPPRCE